MKILFLSSEVAPFSCTGETGDIACSLSKALKGLGHEVRLVTPCYRTIRERRFGLRDVARLRSLQIDIGDKVFECSVKSGFVVGSKVQVYFLENPGFFEKPKSETDCHNEGIGSDCHLAFALLNHGALQLTLLLNWIPDIIHCNGWQTALAPYLLKRCKHYCGSFEQTRIVVNLHDIENQGLFPPELASEIGFSQEEIMDDAPLMYNNSISFLKAGLSMADMIISSNSQIASKTGPVDIPHWDLAQVINNRDDEIYSIKNGVDLETWDPSSDRKIAQQFNIETVSEGKAINKADLQTRLSLPERHDLPVIAILTRFIDDKDINLLEEIEKDIFALPAQFVISGALKPSWKNIINPWMDKYPDRISVNPKDNEALEHQIAAGADLFLFFSHGESLEAYIAGIMKYGALPVITKDITMDDIVVDRILHNPNGGEAIPGFDGPDLLRTIKRIIDLYNDEAGWSELRSQLMQFDFSWSGVAEKYIELYQDVLSRPSYIS